MAQRAFTRRARQLTAVVARLLVWQATTQALGLVAGFALLRWLDTEGYAQYTLAFGFTSSTSLLIDLGFGQAVIALVGERTGDQRLVRSYIASARRMRNVTMVLVLPVAGAVFMAITADKGWSLGVRLALFASVALTVGFRSLQDFYGLPLIMSESHASYLRPQVVSGVIRLAALAAARATGTLTGAVAALLSSVLTIVPALAYRRRSGPVPGADRSRERQRELTRYALPLVPMMVYTAFQSQVAVFVISVVGATRSIAEVGALSRLGQLFTVVGIVNGLLVLPRVARAPRARVTAIVGAAIGTATAFAVAVTLLAVAFPGVFLVLLGGTYSNLRPEIGPYVGAASLGFLSAIVFTINSARAFIYWWLSAALIGGVILVQVLSVLVLDVSATSGVVTFLIITNAVQVLVALAGLAYGLRRGSRLEAAPGEWRPT
jgi:O-antigen/teichoic acid export membrane protein